MIKSLSEDVLENPTNELIYSNYGFYPAFCFKGTDLFIKKISNLIINYSILGRGEIYNLYDNNSKYVLCPEDRLLAGLQSSFRAEVILNHEAYPEIDYKSEINENEEIELTWNEEKVEQAANKLTIDFWTNNIKKINIFQHYNSTESNDEFELGKIDDMKQEKNTE